MNQVKNRVPGALIVGIIALIVSALSFLFTVYWNSPYGEVRSLEPSGYAIIRGVSSGIGQGSFPSDHLVLPMEWKNDSGRPALVKQPELVLSELDKNGVPNDKERRFLLAGEYTNISAEAFSSQYSRKNSIIVEPHSVSLNVLVFHVEDWWDSEGNPQAFNFHFSKNEKYQVGIEFMRNSDEVVNRTTLLEELPIYESASNLSLYGRDEPGWDYWYLR